MHHYSQAFVCIIHLLKIYSIGFDSLVLACVYLTYYEMFTWHEYKNHSGIESTKEDDEKETKTLFVESSELKMYFLSKRSICFFWASACKKSFEKKNEKKMKYFHVILFFDYLFLLDHFKLNARIKVL